MKVKVEIDKSLREDEIIIRCQKLDNNIEKIEKKISNIFASSQLIFYKEDKEYYLSLSNILFFETDESNIYAHSSSDVYKVKYRLYELENILPKYFLRISKSTIININQIFSLSKSLTSSSLVEFYNSHKQVYVSRHYFRELRLRLKERKN